MSRSRFELVANVCSVVNNYAKIYFVHVFYWKRINIVWKHFQWESFNCLINLRIFRYPNYVTKNNCDNFPVSGLSRILDDQISLFYGVFFYEITRNGTIVVFTNTQNWQYWHYCQLVFPEICSFLLYLHYMMLVNVKLDINGSKRITFEDYEIHCSLAILTFLYYGEFVKTSNILVFRLEPYSVRSGNIV